MRFRSGALGRSVSAASVANGLYAHGKKIDLYTLSEPQKKAYYFFTHLRQRVAVCTCRCCRALRRGLCGAAVAGSLRAQLGEQRLWAAEQQRAAHVARYHVLV